MNERLYLLDTNVVLALVRGQALGAFIDGKYGLRASKVRPFVCVVTLGEVRVLAHRNGWGSAKFEALEQALAQLVIIDINRPQVIDAYVALDLASQSHPGGSRNMGKNDLWIAAAAKAAKATLLTTDNDFAHLAPVHLDVEIIDPAGVLPRP